MAVCSSEHRLSFTNYSSAMIIGNASSEQYSIGLYIPADMRARVGSQKPHFSPEA